MGVNEHTIDLINRSLDGDLSGPEQAELDSILANSGEAVAFRNELSGLSDFLASAPSLEPPPDLERKILKQVKLPQPKKWFTFTAGWMQGRPVTYGMGAAIGLLAAVAFYELTPSVSSSQDLTNLVGTMAAGDRRGNPAVIASLEIAEPAVSGTVQLVEKGDMLFLEVDIESQTATELHSQFKDTGLVFEGFANEADEDVEGFLYSRGNFSMASSRKKKFSIVFSAPVTVETMAGSEIQILISEDRGVLYRGAFNL